VYLIDEVHQLSKQAFNSMLKTLEEPPEHVKFVLATTEPEKIPVTVLSRCLQFNLKQLPPPLIVARLATILDAEGIAADPSALASAGACGAGLDARCAIAARPGDCLWWGEVREPVGADDAGCCGYAVRLPIVDALLAADGAALLAEADAMRARSIAFSAALDELASLFHRIAIAQVVPDATDAMDDAPVIASYATRMTAETVQLAYQICVQGRADLALAPDEATGFTMTLLRLLAFEPAQGGAAAIAGGKSRQVRGRRRQRQRPRAWLWPSLPQ
jgi:DNA polymerase-3 subunit gamma/tau